MLLHHPAFLCSVEGDGILPHFHEVCPVPPPGGSEGRRKAEKAEVGGAVVLCLAVPSTGGNLEVRTGNNFSSGRLGCHEWAGVQPASEPNRHTAPEFQLEWLPTTFLLQKP